MHKHAEYIFSLKKSEILLQFVCFFAHTKSDYKSVVQQNWKQIVYVSSTVCILCVCNFSLHLKKRFYSCTLASAIKSNMAAISIETKYGK